MNANEKILLVNDSPVVPTEILIRAPDSTENYEKMGSVLVNYLFAKEPVKGPHSREMKRRKRLRKIANKSRRINRRKAR